MPVETQHPLRTCLSRFDGRVSMVVHGFQPGVEGQRGEAEGNHSSRGHPPLQQRIATSAARLSLCRPTTPSSGTPRSKIHKSKTEEHPSPVLLHRNAHGVTSGRSDLTYIAASCRR